MRLSFPDGYRIPAHSHPAVERVTIIQGTFRVGMGDKFDEAALTPLSAGTFVAMQPGTRHFGQAKSQRLLLRVEEPFRLLVRELFVVATGRV
jgi:quercetin dioxygenase-like cupin family protein